MLRNQKQSWIVDFTLWIPVFQIPWVGFQISRPSVTYSTRENFPYSSCKNFFLFDSRITITLLGAIYFDNNENWFVTYLSVDHSQILHRQWRNDSPSRLGDVPSRTCNFTRGIYMYTKVCSEEMFKNQWVSLADLFSSNSDYVIIAARVKII